MIRSFFNIKVLVLYLSVHFIVTALTLFPAQAQDPVQGESKTIHRTYDAVRIKIGKPQIETLFDENKRRSISNLALYRLEQGKLVEVPFQINVYEEGAPVLDRVNRNVEFVEGTYKKKSDLIDFVSFENHRLLEEAGELVFIIKDTGDRIRKDTLPADFNKGIEVCLEDPVDGGKAWAYLLKDAKGGKEGKQRRRTPKDYVSHELQEVKNKKGKVIKNVEKIVASNYWSIFDITKSASYKAYGVTEQGGGSGENFTLMFRSTALAKIKGLPCKVKLDPEKNIIPHMVGCIDGPVEVQRVIYNKAVLPLFGELEDFSLLTVSRYYPGYLCFTGKVKIPGWVKAFFSAIDSEMATDFNEKAVGMTWYNSNNPVGVRVDGRMDEAEKALNRDPYRWSLIVGEPGGWANILNMKNEIVRDHMRLYYEDDEGYKHGGIYGSTGYTLTEVLDVSEAVFVTYVFSVPPTFVPQDMHQLINLVYHPLRAEFGRSF